ncbi:BCS1 N terminal-domain-containing protein [Fusarium flagelliforme]|uniref:BCS1 N terminal-domain-containing protein n=1 Tax=Fusarium flagelliforme TaxID=2675880 RepID=UPI001E8DB79F|nr:BCS1 N terminal-domain-containing protein [Fusarium flagelliforme]KAH7179401.1 BCS1 N terminal-domain-containing protein [Fusarium flagelliforme]
MHMDASFFASTDVTYYPSSSSLLHYKSVLSFPFLFSSFLQPHLLSSFRLELDLDSYNSGATVQYHNSLYNLAVILQPISLPTISSMLGSLLFLQRISTVDSMASLNSTSPGVDDSPYPKAPSQFAILDFIFPGFSTFSSILHAYLGIDLNVYLPLLLIVSGVIFVWNYITEYSWNIMRGYLMSSVRIKTDDEIYNIVMAWVANQKFAQGSRRFMVNTNISSRSWFLFRWDDEDDDDEGRGGPSKKPLQYTPSVGSHFFWYKGQMLLFERHENRDRSLFSSSSSEELSISCFGRNPRIIKELLLDAQDQYLKKDEKQTVIYRGAMGTNGGEPSWQRCMSRASRPISTVILDEKTKKELVEDVTDYLNPNTRRWYSNRGIPYRRGYLLYGPPGTGKSSLSLALAGFFRMRIYMVSLSSIMATEENLATLFAELPRRCVVLLEDIDSAGLTHTREPTKVEGTTETAVPVPAAPSQPGAPTSGPPTLPGRLSLSGLLNILDGVASQEGRVLIMTTNHLEKLDKALIRPGRVDKIVQFGLADADMSASIFRAIYAPYDGEDVNVGESKAKYLDPEEEKKQAALAEKTRQETMDRVNKLATKFAAAIPALKYSPAEIQGLLLKNKRNPEAAIEAIDEWIIETGKERKQKEIEDAEKQRKEEAAARKKKRKEERKKAKKAKAKAKRRSNGESSGSDSDSDSDSDSEAEVKTDDKKDEDKKDNKDEKSKEKPKEVEAGAEEKKDVQGEESVGESKPKGTSDSGYDTPNPVS